MPKPLLIHVRKTKVFELIIMYCSEWDCANIFDKGLHTRPPSPREYWCSYGLSQSITTVQGKHA